VTDWTQEELDQFAMDRWTDEGGFVTVREPDAERRLQALGALAPDDDAGSPE
jgi:hypothetical protein